MIPINVPTHSHADAESPTTADERRESERQQTAANEKLIPKYILRDAPERAQPNKPFSSSLRQRLAQAKISISHRTS